MSGFLSQVTNLASGIAGGATGLQSLLGGSDTGVTLGSVTLSNFEIPAQIVVPYAQAWVIQRLLGGARVFDDMGDDPGSISWSGLLLGNYANSRAQSLAALKKAAQPITLSWGSFSFQVLIDKFTIQAGYANIPYQIECHVVPPNPTTASAATAATLQNSVTQQIGNALTSVGAAISAVSNAAMATAGVAQRAIGTVSQFAGAVGVTIPDLTTLSQDVTGVQSIAASGSGLAEGSSTVGSLLGSTTSIAGTLDTNIGNIGTSLENTFNGTATSIVQAAGATGALAGLSQAAGQVGSSAITLGAAAANVQTPGNVLTARAGGAGTVQTTAPTPTFQVL